MKPSADAARYTFIIRRKLVVLSVAMIMDSITHSLAAATSANYLRHTGHIQPTDQLLHSCSHATERSLQLVCTGSLSLPPRRQLMTGEVADDCVNLHVKCLVNVLCSI